MRKFAMFLTVMLLGSGCTATTQNQNYSSNKRAVVSSSNDIESTQGQPSTDVRKLEERINLLERELIDIRMDYISRINNLEVDVLDQNEALLKLNKKPGKKVIPQKRVMSKKKVADKKIVVASTPKKLISSEKQLELNYSKSIDLYTSGDYKGSLDILNNMVVGKSKPSLQDNIYYWRGMNQFQLSSYNEAIKNFTVVIENYPKENKYYDGKLMVAISHGMQGEKSLAINELTRLLEENIPEEIKSKAQKAMNQFQK